jgi:ATP-dependent Clp protease ATP-binding subunit ClpX
MICDDCVEQFHDNNQHPERIAEMSRPPWDSMPLPELLSTLTLIIQSAQQNTSFAQEWVDMLREKRASWAEIGKALGVSRQSAWEKYAHRSSNKRATA